MLSSNRSHGRRSGAVLLVVLAMLALFAVIGLSFVFYAESRATAARIYRESLDVNAIPEAPDSTVCSLQAISQLIYDNTDGVQGAGTFSSLRGHSLARAMYGQFYEGQPNAPITALTTNSIPYNGVGPVPTHAIGGLPIVNYMWHTRLPGDPNFNPASSLLDPERTVGRNRPSDSFSPSARYVGKHVSSTYPDANDMAVAMVNPVTGQVIMPSFHRDWLFNAATASSADEWTRQRSLAPPAVVPTNVDWTNAEGKFRLMRPRPAEHCYAPNQSNFPYVPANADGTYTGDVQNLRGAVYPYLRNGTTPAVDATGNPVLIPKNDSVWIDTGAPVEIWNGKRVKPLFAFLVSPTNNKVNINASGNTRGTFADGTPYNHDSGMGLNASEISPLRVMRNSPVIDEEYRRIKFTQYGQIQGAFPAVSPGANQPTPLATNLVRFPGAFAPPVESAVDWDGGAPLNAMRMMLPGTQQNTFGPGQNVPLGQSAFSLAPRFNAPLGFSRYGNGEPTESTNSPYLWNPYLWNTTGTVGVLFSATDLRKMHEKWADDRGLTNETSLGQLAPISVGALRGVPGLSTSPTKSMANRNRANLTTISNSFALHGMMPQTVNHLAGAPFTQPYLWPAPGAGSPPVPVAAGPNVIPDPTNAAYGANKDNTDFNYSASATVNLRASNVANLPPLDLNRPLADYRHAIAVKYDRPLRPDNIIMPKTAPQLTLWQAQNNVTPAEIATYNSPPYQTDAQMMVRFGETESLLRAMNDRQEMAKEIFARLVVATGAPAIYVPWHGYCIPLYPLNPLGEPANAADTPAHDALRYLAQLAANIVDYIDGDDVVTTFVWNPIEPALPYIASPTMPLPHLDPRNLYSGTAPGPFVRSGRFVVGTEKPKLVVNEVYSELTNNQADSSNPNATSPFEIRMWLELMNPGSTDTTYGNVAAPANPHTNAVLYYRNNQQIPSTIIPTPTAYNVYGIEIYRDGTPVQVAHADRRNVDAAPLVPPSKQIDFVAAATLASAAGTTFDVGGPPPDPATNDLARINGYVSQTLRSTGIHFPQEVAPVGTKYRPDVFVNPATNPVNQGYLVLAPGIRRYGAGEYNPIQFAPATPANPVPPPGTPYMPPGYASTGGRIPFEYAVSLDGQLVINGVTQTNEAGLAGALTTINTAPPAVVLRRLANPYFPPNDPVLAPGSYNPALPYNPYLVVDHVDRVLVNDAIRVATNSNLPGSMRPGTQPPPEARNSTVKRHPQGGLVAPYQQPTPVAGDVNQSFFRHNGANVNDPETPASFDPLAIRAPQPAFGQPGADPNLLLTPQTGGRAGFEWMPFMDRPLVNQMELLHVPAVPAHQLQNAFLSGVNPNERHNHVAAWTTHQYGPNTVYGNQSRMYRALELLRVKPWSYATPIGGRVPGKININMVTDPNVLLALADPQSGDFFKATISDLIPPAIVAQYDGIHDAILNPANPLDPSTVYGRLLLKRHATARTMTQIDPTTNPPTLSPVYMPNPDDRPFRSLGSTHLSGNVGAGAFITGGAIPEPLTGHEQTVLGSTPTAAPYNGGVFQLYGNPGLPGSTHPAIRESLLRKITNNLTTTSETYEVYMTVGYFEVMNAGPFYVDLGGGVYSQPILGKEVFKNAPGDLRTRYYAIVDRTNLTVNPAAPNQQGPKPFYLETAAPVGLESRSLASGPIFSMDLNHITAFVPTSVGAGYLVANYDEATGKTGSIQIRVNDYLRVGFGDREEWVQVVLCQPTFGTSTTVNPNPLTGTGRVWVRRNTGRPDAVPVHGNLPIGPASGQLPNLPSHPVGSLVTNAQQGNPGPQPGFDPNKPQYQAVMPYFQKLE